MIIPGVNVRSAFLLAACLASGVIRAAVAAGDTVVPIVASQRVDYASATIYTENDVYVLGTRSDRYYTTGQKFTRISQRLEKFEDAFETSWLRYWAQHLTERARKITAGEQRRSAAPATVAPPPPLQAELRVAFSLGQNMFTPANIHTPVALPNDRPYAAWSYLSTALQARSTSAGPREWLSVWGIDVGAIGPVALGKQVQDFVHDHVAHRPRAEGWDHQLANEPGLNLFNQAKLRWFEGDRRGFGADAIGHAGFSVGNVSTYANTGATVRLGFGLPDDFGPDVIRSGADTSQAGGTPPPWGAHIFGGFDTRIVGRDISLDGNTFAHSQHVAREVFVGDFQFGLSLTFRRWTICLSQVRRTPEFKLQNHAQAYGSITLTFPLPRR